MFHVKHSGLILIFFLLLLIKWRPGEIFINHSASLIQCLFGRQAKPEYFRCVGDNREGVKSNKDGSL